MKKILIRIGYFLLSLIMIYGIFRNIELAIKYMKKAFNKTI